MSGSSTRAPQVLVIGFGALGSIYALALSKAGAEITAVCRSNYAHVKEHGLTINSDKFGSFPNWKPYKVIMGPEEAREQFYDYVICTFKCVPDLEPTSDVIRPYLRNPADFPNETVPETGLPCIVLMQNGVGTEQEPYHTLVRREGLAGSIVSAVSWVASNLLDGGKRVQHGSLERLSLGLYPSPLSTSVAEIEAKSESDGASAGESLRTVDLDHAKSRLDGYVKLLQEGGATPEPSSDVQPQRWKKLLWNASWGALSTVARQPIAALVTDASLHYTVSSVRRLMLEILYVGRACGLDEAALPASSVDDALRVTLDMRAIPQSAEESASLKSRGQQAVSAEPPAHEKPKHTMSSDFKPSLLLDLENGRPMELLPIIGNVIELARIHRVETPRLDLVMAALRPAQVAAIEAARRKWGTARDPKPKAEDAVDGPTLEGTPVGSSE